MVVTLKRWVGKTAIVTGASAGIGKCVVEKLLEAGVNVVGFARRVEKMQELCKQWSKLPGKFHAQKVDMTCENDIVKGFQWVSDNVGPVHILINNAGLMTNTSLSDGDSSLWKKILDTNVLGLSIATREGIKIMTKNKIDGHIIHVNSIVGHQVPNFPNCNMYPASKFAVTALAETLRYELVNAKSGIKITSVSPGAVQTEFIDASGHKLPEEYLKNVPFLDPADVADTIIFALSTPPKVLIKELTVKPMGEPM